MHKPLPLISALIFPSLGLSLLFCFAARPLTGPASLPSADTGETCQPKPAATDKTRLTLLHCQYGNYERCRSCFRMAQTESEEARWRKNTNAAIRLYNQVADDTDPSAFALTSLPRHLHPTGFE